MNKNRQLCQHLNLGIWPAPRVPLVIKWNIKNVSVYNMHSFYNMHSILVNFGQITDKGTKLISNDFIIWLENNSSEHLREAVLPPCAVMKGCAKYLLCFLSFLMSCLLFWGVELKLVLNVAPWERCVNLLFVLACRSSRFYKGKQGDFFFLQRCEVQ